ncbi:MAG: SGNH/GDSL hydrolase family protein, partial [Lachnospiraceae bacterium]|nr:SGNH/GDSL hydrolase family protein [Lachnospiraceae bacterium]
VETCFPRSRVINNSCSRIDSTQVLACLDQLVEEDDDLVLLEVGTNDRKREDGAKCLTENLRKLIRILQERGKRVILMCPNPSTATNEAQANRFFHMDQVNAIMAEAAEEAGILFVSQYEYILGELTREGRDLETLMMDGVGVHDGLHPPDRVHEMMFDHLLEALKLPPACEIINIHG